MAGVRGCSWAGGAKEIVTRWIKVASMTAAQRSATTGQITKGGHLDVFSLHAGDCFQSPPGSQLDSGLGRVTVVPCASLRSAQVIAQLPAQGSAYPGEAAFRAQAVPGCKARVAAVVDRSKVAATMKLIYLYPQPQAWAKGQRTIKCVVVDSSQDLTSSLLK